MVFAARPLDSSIFASERPRFDWRPAEARSRARRRTGRWRTRRLGAKL